MAIGLRSQEKISSEESYYESDERVFCECTL